jgi:hypothetical protein
VGWPAPRGLTHRPENDLEKIFLHPLISRRLIPLTPV